MLSCPRCHGHLKIIAFITELTVVKKILPHLHLPTELQEPLAARLPPQLELDDDQAGLGEPHQLRPSPVKLPRLRAPPD